MNLKPANSHKFLVDVNLPKRFHYFKSSNFFDLFLISEHHPKVVNFRFGNLTLDDLHQYFEKFWSIILVYLDSANFIIAQEDKFFVFP